MAPLPVPTTQQQQQHQGSGASISAAQTLLLSPAELACLRAGLTTTTPHPLRPDGRRPTQFRPLLAERGDDVVPAANGGARITFADGSEAIVGVKAEVERTRGSGGGSDGKQEEEEETRPSLSAQRGSATKRERARKVASRAGHTGHDDDEDGQAAEEASPRVVSNQWLELSVEVPGLREDDGMPVFMAAMLSEALLAASDLTRRLWINARWHWRLYIDILLLSQPSSYPLPLLSLTTHLALMSTRLPRLKSEHDEDPLFDDDWDASVYLFPQDPSSSSPSSKPPVTLLVMAIEDNILFDPSAEELAVAESVLAVSVIETGRHASAQTDRDRMDVDVAASESRSFQLVAIRTIDPPSRLTYPGTPNFMNTAAGGTAAETNAKATRQRETMDEQGVWQPPRGGMKRRLMARMVHEILKRGGVAEEVFDGLAAVDLG